MRCFVAGDDTAAAERVRDVLVELGHPCPDSHVNSLDRVWGDLDKGAAGPPDPQSNVPENLRARQSVAEVEIVVVVLAPDPERALEAVRSNRRRTAARILLVGPVTDTRLVLRALREGANEFLDQADLKAELAAALKRLSIETSPGKTIALLSGSGGSGCSTLAVNLAVGLAKTHLSCALLDLQLQAGDLATLLDLKPNYSIADLCLNVHRLDASLMEGCMMPHSSGVQLLAAPRNLADGLNVTEDCINQVALLVARRFPFALADLGNSFRIERTRILLQADLILVVLRLDFACLRNTRAALEYLTEIGIAKSRIEVVANRSGVANEIARSAAEEALGVKISHDVPDDARTVNRANNNGMPVLLQAPSTKVSRAIAKLVTHISKVPATQG